MANNLVGFRYIQPDDPGAPPSTGYEWLNSVSGELSYRNIGNTAWVSLGNINDTKLGLVGVTGQTMTGPLLGVTGWAPDTAPDFQTSAKRMGIELATKGDISSLRRELIARFNTITQEMIANLSTSSNTKANIAFKSGISAVISNTSFTIPLPQYDGGSGETAIRSEVVAYNAFIYRADIPGGAGDDTIEIQLTSDPNMTFLVRSGYANGTNWAYGIQVGYFVMALR